MTTITLKPIGVVKTEMTKEEVRHRQGVSRLLIFEEYADALEGIEDYSHLFVLYYMHEIEPERRAKFKTKPRGEESAPLVGVFATHNPGRPNPLGLSIVELVERRENDLVVRGLDAYDSTPIVDLKPYDPWDVVKDPKVPAWWDALEEARKHRK